MAHTDKDRPYWVRIRDYNLIEHDHTRGECIVDDDRRNRWSSWTRHWRNCRKRITVEWSCTKAEPNRVPSRYVAYGVRADLWGQTCWTWVCGCEDFNPHHICPNRVRVQCIGHSRRETDDSIPCVCDDREPRATCFPTEPDSVRYSCFGGGGVPSEYVRSVWHGPERRREREDLRDAACLYNAGEDLEDFDFPCPQARSQARWLYH